MMPIGSSAVPAWLRLRNFDERRTHQSELFRARYDGKRLAGLRRVLTALLIVAGTPVVMLERTVDPGVQRSLTYLAIVWLAMCLPMIRLLCAEWRNRRLVENLEALVYRQEES